MVDLWILHNNSLRRTFDQSLMKLFQRIQAIWSRQESVTEGQTDRQTDRQKDRWTDRQMKTISIIPHPLCGRGLKMANLFANGGDPDQIQCSAASDLGLHCLPITLLRVSQLQWVNMLYHSSYSQFSLLYTVQPQWLEHDWLIYLG